MKKQLLYIFVLLSLFSIAQPYPNQNISLLALIDPNTSTATIGPDGRKYAGCWGWHQPSTNKEYAIACGSNGTYFIDVTLPSTPSVCAFVPGRISATNREAKTYQNYCYVVCDEAPPNTFQIIDMSTLPATVTLVHDNKTYFERGHTIFIEQDKMYIGLATYSTGILSPMNIYSLATPTAPLLLREVKQDIPIINTVHDMFVRQDTIFASCGYQGLYILKLNANNTLTQLGSYTGYAASAFNHSSMLTQDGKYLMFCDEDPAGLPIRFVDVQNFSNVQPVQTFNPFAATTPHNPFLIGNKWAIVSCYQDGLYIYDISQPGNAVISGYFDTYPQSGGNINNYFGQVYRGNWGAYPYLPSGIIIATDMQNGVFILDPTNAFNNPAGIKNNSTKKADLIIYPNPVSETLHINYNSVGNSIVLIKNVLGQLVFVKQFSSSINESIDLRAFEGGPYIISISNGAASVNKKLIVSH
ncbi:MAG: choice-of-anchor B family protein [Bacteroidetes bacterium]|nr:choice-of-anchor B family protein [Bacteroidota bacterium]